MPKPNPYDNQVWKLSLYVPVIFAYLGFSIQMNIPDFGYSYRTIISFYFKAIAKLHNIATFAFQLHVQSSLLVETDDTTVSFLYYSSMQIILISSLSISSRSTKLVVVSQHLIILLFCLHAFNSKSVNTKIYRTRSVD